MAASCFSRYFALQINSRFCNITTFDFDEGYVFHRLRMNNAKELVKSFQSSSIFSNKLAPKLRIDYPWLMSNQRKRSPMPSFLDAIKAAHLIKVATKRTKTHLHDPAYVFPEQFYADSAKTLTESFSVLSHPAMSTSMEHMQKNMVRGLANMFIDGRLSLASKKELPSFIIHKEPKISIKKIHLTYGPYPPPAGYVAQEWIGN
jgi:hypothetical protein